MSTKNLLVDILSILPEEIECFIQAPSLENDIIQSMMSDANADYYKLLRINNVNKNEFIKQILEHSISDYFQNIQIKSNNSLLFEGFDGVEYGTLSNSIFVPQWFNELYVLTETCTISNEW